MIPTRAIPATRSFMRAFSTSMPKKDLAKLTLIGRLGNDPARRESSSGKEYYQYSLATQGPPLRDAEGNFTEGPTSWHNVFSFSEYQHNMLKSLGKGSTVYVEADLEMRKSEPIGDQQVPDRVLLRQTLIKPINRVKQADSETAAE